MVNEAADIIRRRLPAMLSTGVAHRRDAPRVELDQVVLSKSAVASEVVAALNEVGAP